MAIIYIQWIGAIMNTPNKSHRVVPSYNMEIILIRVLSKNPEHL